MTRSELPDRGSAFLQPPQKQSNLRKVGRTPPTGFMEHDAPASPGAPATQAIAAPVSGREQLAQQLISGKGDSGSIFAQLSSNPFFTAGFGLAALGVAARIGQKSVVRGASLLRKRLLVDVEITRHDESYQWFLQWMSAYTRSQALPGAAYQDNSFVSRILRRVTPNIHHLSMQTSKSVLPNGATTTHFSLVPGQGRHILRYRNAFMVVKRERDGKAVEMSSGKPFETITLTTLFAHRHIFESLFQEAHALAEQAQEGKTIIYTPLGFQWKAFGEPKRKRPLDSVTLADGVKENIVADVQAFLGARNWYLDRGIPYRRGYLLYGPPGTGKSSFIQALAGELDFNIAMLNLSQKGLVDDHLNVLLTNVPARSLVLLEDADVAFVNRQQMDAHGYSGSTVTFSGLLNALDGVASAEERLIFLTTNHIERLDEALVRPGRIDMTIRLGEATQGQVEHMWDRFYAEQDQDGDLKGQFLARLAKLELLGKVSTAALQGLFLSNKTDALGAIQMAEQLRPHRGR